MVKYGRVYGIRDKKYKKYVYVGKTERLYDYKPHGKVIKKLFLKYPKRYIYQVLENNISVSSLNKKERFYIKKYNTYNDKKCFNFTPGGDGGDTMSQHPRKSLIFKKRSKMYPAKKGESNLNFIKLPLTTENYIIKVWQSLDIPYLKELANKTKISKHVCKRTLLKYGFSIPDKHRTQKALLKAGIIKPSRYVEFTQSQLSKIINLYSKHYMGAKKIARKFGYRSEDVILKVLRKNNIKIYSKSEMTRYNNLKRSHNGSYKKK